MRQHGVKKQTHLSLSTTADHVATEQGLPFQTELGEYNWHKSLMTLGNSHGGNRKELNIDQPKDELKQAMWWKNQQGRKATFESPTEAKAHGDKRRWGQNKDVKG